LGREGSGGFNAAIEDFDIPLAGAVGAVGDETAVAADRGVTGFAGEIAGEGFSAEALAIVEENVGFAVLFRHVDEIATIGADVRLVGEDTLLIETGEGDQLATLEIVEKDALLTTPV
jgi:hypothetical protein